MRLIAIGAFAVGGAVLSAHAKTQCFVDGTTALDAVESNLQAALRGGGVGRLRPKSPFDDYRARLRELGPKGNEAIQYLNALENGITESRTKAAQAAQRGDKAMAKAYASAAEAAESDVRAFFKKFSKECGGA